MAACQNHLGNASMEAGRPADAAPLLEEAAGRLGAMGVRRVRGRALAWLGEAYRALGLPERAGALGREARALATATGSPYGLAWAERLLGRLARDAGDQAAARRLLESALRGFADTHARFEVGRTHLELGELAEASAERDAARVHFGLAREAFVACGAPVYVARAASHL